MFLVLQPAKEAYQTIMVKEHTVSEVRSKVLSLKMVHALRNPVPPRAIHIWR